MAPANLINNRAEKEYIHKMTQQLCQGCNKFYKIDISIPDFLWEQITRIDNYEYLCGKCIMERLEKLAENMELLDEHDHWFLVTAPVAEYWLSNPPEEEE